MHSKQIGCIYWESIILINFQIYYYLNWMLYFNYKSRIFDTQIGRVHSSYERIFIHANKSTKSNYISNVHIVHGVHVHGYNKNPLWSDIHSIRMLNFYETIYISHLWIYTADGRFSLHIPISHFNTYNFFLFYFDLLIVSDS